MVVEDMVRWESECGGGGYKRRGCDGCEGNDVDDWVRVEVVLCVLVHSIRWYHVLRIRDGIPRGVATDLPPESPCIYPPSRHAFTPRVALSEISTSYDTRHP